MVALGDAGETQRGHLPPVVPLPQQQPVERRIERRRVVVVVLVGQRGTQRKKMHRQNLAECRIGEVGDPQRSCWPLSCGRECGGGLTEGGCAALDVHWRQCPHVHTLRAQIDVAKPSRRAHAQLVVPLPFLITLTAGK